MPIPSAEWTAVVLAALAGASLCMLWQIATLLQRISTKLDAIARTASLWSERWNERYGPPEPRYPGQR